MLSTPVQKTRIRYASLSEREDAWKANRIAYTEWRHSDDGRKFVVSQTKKQHNLCFICITPLYGAVHVDHIYPLYLGGTNDKVNLCVAHADCNMKKGTGLIMSYKQVCSRKKLFNDIRRGLRAYRMIGKKPGYMPDKRILKAMKVADQYIRVAN